MRQPGFILSGAALLLALACGGGKPDNTPPPGPASALAYTNPTDLARWRLMKNPGASTGTHLVLDLVAPPGTSGQGVTLVLTANSGEASWALLDGGAYASPSLVRIASVQGSDLRTVVAQAPGSPVSYGRSPVLSFSLDLAKSALTGPVGLSVAQAGHLDAGGTNPVPITVEVGSLQAQ